MKILPRARIQAGQSCGTMLKLSPSLMASMNVVPSELILEILKMLFTIRLHKRLPPIVLKDPHRRVHRQSGTSGNQ